MWSVSFCFAVYVVVSCGYRKWNWCIFYSLHFLKTNSFGVCDVNGKRKKHQTSLPNRINHCTLEIMCANWMDSAHFIRSLIYWLPEPKLTHNIYLYFVKSIEMMIGTRHYWLKNAVHKKSFALYFDETTSHLNTQTYTFHDTLWNIFNSFATFQQ